MRKIIVSANITLDGVMQAPMDPTEDTSGGFKYGGWTAPNADATSGKAVQKEMNQTVDYLLGRKTFEIFNFYWNMQQKMWPGINTNTKYVLSNTIKTSNWKNTVFLQSVQDIKQLKNSEGLNLQVWGSSQLINLLLENGLVDELHLRIFPIILGNGKNIFTTNALAASFTLTENTINLVIHVKSIHFRIAAFEIIVAHK